MDDGSCRYKTPDGLKCAVGCLIPDELYNEKMEGSMVNRISEELEFLKPHVPMLMGLQLIHDNEEYWDEKGINKAGRDQLDFVARMFSLSPYAISYPLEDMK